jgi:pyrroline-5-carboxylate reductase
VKLAAIGTGKLGSAILRGWSASGQLLPAELTLPGRPSGVALAAELGARVMPTNRETVLGAEVLLLAVKPYQLVSVLTEVREALAPTGSRFFVSCPIPRHRSVPRPRRSVVVRLRRTPTRPRFRVSSRR